MDSIEPLQLTHTPFYFLYRNRYQILSPVKQRIENENCQGNHWKRVVDIYKGVRKKGGLGLNPPLELDILQKLYYLRKEIKCFRILFAC